MKYRDSADGTKPLLFSRVRHTGQCHYTLSGILLLTFCFIDNEAALRNTEMAHNIGLIEIQILRSQAIGEIPWKRPRTVMAGEVDVLHESTKKIGMHCVS